MRYNERELRLFIKNTPSILEGNLIYFDRKEGAKERRLKLVNSVLAMFRLSPTGLYAEADPAEIILLTNVRVVVSKGSQNEFSLVCPGVTFDTTYMFKCKSVPERDRWVNLLSTTSYSSYIDEAARLRALIDAKRSHSQSHTIIPAAVPKLLHSRPAPSRPAPPLPPRSQPRTQPNVTEGLLIDLS